MPGIQKILIVEDNIALSKLYSEFLSKSGFIVDVTENGNKALEKVSNNTPDLLFIDVMMPGMGGFELVRKLRREEQYGCTHSKMVLLTNLGKEQIPKDINEDIDGYALKAAIQLDDLLKIIQSFDIHSDDSNVATNQ